MYAGERLSIATMHKKESVIAPILETETGVNCFTCPDLNTDLLGTFSGEIERLATPLETARQKCILATEATACDLAVSSEGSFGPHPAAGFFGCDEEILLFFDRKNSIEIAVKELSTNTNFSGGEFRDFGALKEFAVSCLFPSHGLIIKDGEGRAIEKGIVSWSALEDSFHRAAKTGFPVKVETDMRAHVNPTRMKVIETCAKKLAAAINSCCPQCQRPGFIVCASEPGLPCELCHLPTKSPLKHIAICRGCNYRREIVYPFHKTHEEPAFCNFCNP